MNSFNRAHAHGDSNMADMTIKEAAEMTIDEALDVIEQSGRQTNSIQRNQISFALYELKYIMKDKAQAPEAAKAIKSAAISTIRNFFKGLEIPGGLSKADLRFHVQINDGGEDKDPYFMFFINKAPGIEELFKKAFSADIEVDDEGWCTKFALPQDYLRQALNEFMMNA